jgi:hypothetical protein
MPLNLFDVLEPTDSISHLRTLSRFGILITIILLPMHTYACYIPRTSHTPLFYQPKKPGEECALRSSPLCNFLYSHSVDSNPNVFRFVCKK